MRSAFDFKFFDYFINIRAQKVKEDIAGIDSTPHRFKKLKKNQSEVTIEVYDLNLAEIIYSQKVIGITQRENDNDDVHFSKTSRNLIMGAYRKLMNSIEKSSIKSK